jgi:hypothetical protein
MQIWDLKVWREFEPAVQFLAPPFQVRLGDRSYEAGDLVVFHVVDRADCPYCDGAGFVADVPCHKCLGKGYTTTDTGQIWARVVTAVQTLNSASQITIGGRAFWPAADVARYGLAVLGLRNPTAEEGYAWYLSGEHPANQPGPSLAERTVHFNPVEGPD